MEKLSVTIITYNEEDKIQRTLDSVKDIADEIVVLDSYSADRTVEIINSNKNIKLVQQKFKGHVEQKNDAIALASYDYILSVDADEVVSSELKDSILKIKNNFQNKAYSFNRLTYYKDKPVRHCGWYPDKKLRIFNKSHARWEGVNPHDIVKADTGVEINHLSGDLLHYSYDSISDHVQQTNYFTNIAAKEAFDRGVRSSYFKIVNRTILKFLKDFILKRGFLDGRMGFVICIINALSACLKYSKIKELEDYSAK